MSQSKYQPEKGTEDYVHVRVTEKQGQKLAEPVIEQYHPNAYANVAKLAGFKGDVVHDPRTAAQKAAQQPAAGEEQGQELEQYRQRYKEIFREEAPFNLDLATVKSIVERADLKLKTLANDLVGTPATPGDATQGEGEQTGTEGTDLNKLPSNKKEWFALFQQTFPDDITAYEDITEKAIRERLGK